MSYVSRLLQGAGAFIVFQSAWAILGIVYATNITHASTVFNMGMTIGLAGGPFLGGSIYKEVGYAGTFFVFGVAVFLYLTVKSCFDVEQLIASSPVMRRRGGSYDFLEEELI